MNISWHKGIRRIALAAAIGASVLTLPMFFQAEQIYYGLDLPSWIFEAHGDVYGAKARWAKHMHSDYLSQVSDSKNGDFRQADWQIISTVGVPGDFPSEEEYTAHVAKALRAEANKWEASADSFYALSKSVKKVKIDDLSKIVVGNQYGPKSEIHRNDVTFRFRWFVYLLGLVLAALTGALFVFVSLYSVYFLARIFNWIYRGFVPKEG